MAPTRIYVKPLLQLIKQTGAVKAMAHITGGGLLDNIPRVLPDNAQAVIDVASWNRPAVFDWLQEQGNVDETEMHRVLNCGVGMVICVAQSDAEKALEVLRAAGEQPWQIGRIETCGADAERVVLNNLKTTDAETLQCRGADFRLRQQPAGADRQPPGRRHAGRIRAVISSRADAYGLERARQAGIQTEVLSITRPMPIAKASTRPWHNGSMPMNRTW